MKRRHFLRAAAATTVLPALFNGLPMRAFGANPMLHALTGADAESDRVLVLVFLNGGNDGLNTVIPLDQYSGLASARSNVLIPQAQALPLNGHPTVGLHPAMTGLRDLFNQQQVQIVQSVGYPMPNFSHFRSTDIWTSASASDQYLTTGWVGRYLEKVFPGFPAGYPSAAMPDPLALQLAASLPLAFQGSAANLAMTVSSPSLFTGWTLGLNDPAPATPAGTELTFIRTLAQQTQQYSTAIVNAYVAGANAYTGYPAAGANYLADLLKFTARVIKGGMKTRVYLLSLGGFDTHADQAVSGAPTTGTHAKLLSMFSQAMFAFQQDVNALGIGDRVLTLAFSEFGRRIKSNASMGTDHGAGGPVFVVGNRVQPGILGSNPVLPGTITDEDNLPMQYDFRSVYGSVLKDWFCAPQNDIDDILLGSFQHLPIVNADCTQVYLDEVRAGSGRIRVWNSPNPFTTATYVQFEAVAGPVLLQLFDAQGREVCTLARGQFAAGKHQVWWENPGLPAGNYSIRLQNGPLVGMSWMQIAR